MNMRTFHHRAPKRIGGDDFEQTRPIRTRVIKKQRPLVDWRDPFEVGGAIAAAIGIAVVLGMLASLL